MVEIVQSAGGIIYYHEKDWSPRYLLIKRLALSWKIERVAPKGKIQAGETAEQAALREVGEECGISPSDLKLEQKIWKTSLRSSETKRGHLDKDVTYFLMNYSGDPSALKITDGEWYVGIYKWASIQEVLGLLYYGDIRELIRKAHLLHQGDETSKINEKNK